MLRGKKKNPTKSICASVRSRETTLGTSVGDTCDGVRLGGARNRSSRRVHKGQSGTNQRCAALGDGELSANTLCKPSRDTGILSTYKKISDSRQSEIATTDWYS